MTVRPISPWVSQYFWEAGGACEHGLGWRSIKQLEVVIWHKKNHDSTYSTTADTSPTPSPFLQYNFSSLAVNKKIVMVPSFWPLLIPHFSFSAYLWSFGDAFTVGELYMDTHACAWDLFFAPQTESDIHRYESMNANVNTCIDLWTWNVTLDFLVHVLGANYRSQAKARVSTYDSLDVSERSYYVWKRKRRYQHAGAPLQSYC